MSRQTRFRLATGTGRARSKGTEPRFAGMIAETYIDGITVCMPMGGAAPLPSRRAIRSRRTRVMTLIVATKPAVIIPVYSGVLLTQ